MRIGGLKLTQDHYQRRERMYDSAIPAVQHGKKASVQKPKLWGYWNPQNALPSKFKSIKP